MKRGRVISRRQFGAGAAAAAAVLPFRALAQTAAPTAVGANPWGELGAIAAQARQLGLAVPRMSLGLTGGTAYNDTMPAVVDFIDHLKASAAAANAAPADVDALLKRASALLMTINNAERSPRAEPTELGAQLSQFTFESLRDEYVSLFNSCVISDAHRAQVTWYVNKLTDTTYDKSYDTVEDAVCIPWYFVGIIHAMEEDAVTIEGFANQTDWSLARTLYRMEAYNGFGSRRKGINTPYLWAFSNHYTKGKYVADGKWNPDYVSTQCGGAVMLKALITGGKAALPS